MARTADHPGVVIARRIENGETTIKALVEATGLSQSLVNQIKLGTRNITPDVAVRFGIAFGDGSKFWMDMQTQYDIELAERNIRKSKSRPTRLPKAA